MSTLDLTSLDVVQPNAEEKLQTPMQEVNDCLKACKFGRFNIKLLAVTFVGFISGVGVISTTSYLLPSAECDLNMTLLQKGVLTAIAYLGMLFSSVFAGFLTDTFGRKIFLLFGFGGTFLFTIISGTSQTYNVLVTSKFFEGLLFASCFSAVVSFSSEFYHNDIRDRIIILQSSFAVLSQIIIAAISWAVLIQDWKYTMFGGYIVQPNAEEKLQTPMQEVNDCLKACKFGRFNIKLLAVTFVGFISGVGVISTTSYLLPSAECDLNMTLLQKGVLTAIAYLGMLFSSVFAGFLTDTFGRKIFLLFGFGGTFLFTIISGTSQTYNVLVTSKFFEGLLFASCFSAVVSFSSEFYHNDIRDRIIILQSSFAVLSQIIIAAISWAVLIQDWKYTMFGGYIVLNTWNFYLYIISFWSLLALILYSFLPESPKYLVMQKEYAKAREILINMYKENTGKSADTYPYKDIWTNEIREKNEISESQQHTSFSKQIVVGLHNIKPMFRKPLVQYLVLICLINFMTMAASNIISLWFPQVSTVMEHYKDGDQDLCTVLDTYTEDLSQRQLNTTAETKCLATRSGAETYINSMIIGGVSVVPILLTGILVNYIGKKTLIMLGCLFFSGATLGMRWASTKTAVVALFAVDVCIGQTSKSLTQAYIVEFFSTSTRSLALSIMMMLGRIGTLLGNVAFPVLLSMSCQLPFFLISGIMLGLVLLAFFLPTQREEKAN